MADDCSRLDDLIAQARTDHSRLGRLLERYRPFLLLLAQSRIGTKLAVRCDPEDVVQQTLAEVCATFPQFKGSTEPEFSAWIKCAHRHNLEDAIRKHVLTRKQSLRNEHRLDIGDGTASFCWNEPAAERSTPSQRMIQGEKALQLAGLLQALPEMQREAVRLRYLEGWPVDEIAQELDRSVAATAGLIKRGLKALRSDMSASSWMT